MGIEAREDAGALRAISARLQCAQCPPLLPSQQPGSLRLAWEEGPQGCSRSQAGPDSNCPASDPGLPISPSDPGSRFPFALLLPPRPENFLSEPLSNGINCFRGGELPVPGGMQGDAHKGQGILSSQGGKLAPSPPTQASVAPQAHLKVSPDLTGWPWYVPTLPGPLESQSDTRMCLKGCVSPRLVLMVGQLASARDAGGTVGVPTSCNLCPGSPRNPPDSTYTPAAYTATLPPSRHLIRQLQWFGLQASERMRYTLPQDSLPGARVESEYHTPAPCYFFNIQFYFFIFACAGTSLLRGLFSNCIKRREATL